MKTLIEKYEFKTGLPLEFEITDIQALYNQCTDALIKPHRTNFYHILWIQKGKNKHTIDFNTMELQSNSLLFVNKNIVQVFDKKSKLQGKAIFFTDAFFCKSEKDNHYLISNPLFNNPNSIAQIKLDDDFKSLLTMLFQLLEIELQKEKDDYQSDILKKHLHTILLLSEREYQKQFLSDFKINTDNDLVLQFKRNIENLFRTQKKVSDYSGQMGVSEKRLNQATTNVLGKSPKEIINDRIILEAKRLLVYTSSNIKEISYFLGFEEPTNFIKFFKKHNNSTPIAFRASQL